jgi:1-deoxy-D-xylulose-5-phosphate synthase
MNHAGGLGRRLFVILNDNDMSIAPPVGALAGYLRRLRQGAPLSSLRDLAEGLEMALPAPLRAGARRARALVTGDAPGGNFFEDLGFSYIGPVDGHDLPTLLATLRAARARATGPVLIHALTTKGKGYAPAEAAPCRMHGVAQVTPRAGQLRLTVLQSGKSESGDRIVFELAAPSPGDGATPLGVTLVRKVFEGCGGGLRLRGGASQAIHVEAWLPEQEST